MEKTRIKLSDMMMTLLMPNLLGKAAIVYFGLMYSGYPGEGYGYGLVIAILFTVCMSARFVWKYRNYKDRDDD